MNTVLMNSRKDEMSTPTKTACRFCGSELQHTFADLGLTPLANSYVKPEALNQKEPVYPLHAFVCHKCFLVQLGVFESPEAIFSDYAYFSSFSDSWLEHCKAYVQDVIQRFKLGPGSKVIELASNDGYLLQYFVEAGIPVLGIEPAANVAAHATEKGIPTLTDFFGTRLAEELAHKDEQADLLIANNVLAHVPNLNDFVEGIKQILKPKGVFTIEFPHLLSLMQKNQFDTIYHEHFSYFSLLTVESVFAAHGLMLFDVTLLPTHGGSLRIFGQHREHPPYTVEPNLNRVKQMEIESGLDHLETYLGFQEKVKSIRDKLVSNLKAIKSQGKTVVGYGAPAKGNTLLNYCKIGPEYITYTVDRNPYKQKLLLPGTHIPIQSPDKIFETKPDYLLVLPWNIKEEVMQQMSSIRDWGGQFLIPIPEVEIV